MKKIISALTAAIMIFSICAINVFADTKPTFSVNTATAGKGEEVEVTLSVENVTASALTVQVKFDTNVLEATGGTLLQQVGMMKQINAADNANTRGLYDYSMFAMADEAFADGGLATLKFKVKDTATLGDTALEVVVSAMQTAGAEVTDYVLNDGKVTVKCTSHNIDGVDWEETTPAGCETAGEAVKKCKDCGEVADTKTIDPKGHDYPKFSSVCNNGCGIAGVLPEKPEFSVTSVSGIKGEEVEVTLNVKNLVTSALTLQVKFDKNILEATGGTLLQQIGMMKQINAADNANTRGLYDYSMFDMSDATFADGGLATLKFKIKDTAPLGDTALEVVVSAMQMEGADAVLANWYKATDGKITVIDCVHDTTGVDWEVTEPAKCEIPGTKVKKCTICGEVAETDTIDAIGHDYAWNETTPATCDAQGEETGVCRNDATHTTTRAIDALGFAWDAGTETTPATCDTAGVKTFTCTNGCNHTRTEAIDALGFAWDAGTVTTPAGCETEGVMTYTCTNGCNHTKTDTIDATGHDYAWNETTPATCDAQGEETGVCRNDATHTTTRAIDALGFAWDAGTVTTPATCLTEGVKTFTCTNGCNHTKIEVIDPLGFAWDAGTVTTPATCDTAGVKTFTCTNGCNHTRTEAIDALGFAWDAGTVTTPATCKAEGVMTYTCTNGCNHTKTEAIAIDPDAHDFGDWTEKTPATCEGQGEEERVCSLDATHVETRPTDPTGHDIRWVVTKEPTATEEGIRTKDCWNADCDYQEVTEPIAKTVSSVEGEGVKMEITDSSDADYRYSSTLKVEIGDTDAFIETLKAQLAAIGTTEDEIKEIVDEYKANLEVLIPAVKDKGYNTVADFYLLTEDEKEDYFFGYGPAVSGAVEKYTIDVVDELKDATGLKLYTINEDGIVEVKATIADGKITFTSDDLRTAGAVDSMVFFLAGNVAVEETPEVPGENKPAGPEAPGTGVEFPALLAVLFLASAAAVVISKKRAHN